MNTNESHQEWTQTTEHMPEIGHKIVVYLWVDEAVCQAWWNGEHYVVVAADEQGAVQIYQIKPEAISHWREMPETPNNTNTVNESQWHQKQLIAIH